MENLINHLKEFKKHSFAHVETLTNQKSNYKKTGNPFEVENIFKKLVFLANINFEYQKSVNNKLEKMGENPDFEAQKGWHVFLDNGCRCIVTNAKNDKYYLYCKVEKYISSQLYIKENNKLRLLTETEIKTLNSFKYEREVKIVSVLKPEICNVTNFKMGAFEYNRD
jgi:hypothetical protein